MPRINYKQSAYVSATIALFLIVGNIYYFFIYRDVGLSYYFEKAFSPGKDAVLNTPDYLGFIRSKDTFHLKKVWTYDPIERSYQASLLLEGQHVHKPFVSWIRSHRLYICEDGI